MTAFRNFSGLFFFPPFVACCVLFSACTHIDLYERAVPVPAHQWQSRFKPSFAFNVTDTAAAYQLYFIVRHTNQYRYNNIWVNLYAKGPSDTAKKFTLELPLANKQGWLGAGMGDVFEHRIAFALDPSTFRFGRAGEYTFTLEQIMRDDPLPAVMSVGLRLEKKP